MSTCKSTYARCSAYSEQCSKSNAGRVSKATGPAAAPIRESGSAGRVGKATSPDGSTHPLQVECTIRPESAGIAMSCTKSCHLAETSDNARTSEQNRHATRHCYLTECNVRSGCLYSSMRGENKLLHASFPAATSFFAISCKHL